MSAFDRGERTFQKQRGRNEAIYMWDKIKAHEKKRNNNDDYDNDCDHQEYWMGIAPNQRICTIQAASKQNDEWAFFAYSYVLVWVGIYMYFFDGLSTKKWLY